MNTFHPILPQRFTCDRNAAKLGDLLFVIPVLRSVVPYHLKTTVSLTNLGIRLQYKPERRPLSNSNKAYSSLLFFYIYTAGTLCLLVRA